jgi:hypothetical protein
LLLVDACDTLLYRLSAFYNLFRVLTASSDFKPPAGLPGREKPLATDALDPRQRSLCRFCLPAPLPRVLPTVVVSAMLLYVAQLPAYI